MRNIIIFCLVLVMVFSSSIFASEQKSTNPELDKANKAFDNQNFKLAIELYEKVIAQDPKNKNALFWAAGAALSIKDYKKEIIFLNKLKLLDPKGLKPREMLVQAYQESNNVKLLKAERDDLFALYHKHKDTTFKENKYYIREKFKVGVFTIVAIEYYELSGKLPKRYFFYGQRNTDKSAFVVSLGSYPWTTEIERQMGTIGKDERIYHLDGYDGERHYTYGFSEVEPDYQSSKSSAIEIFKQEKPGGSAASSSPFKGGLNP